MWIHSQGQTALRPARPRWALRLAGWLWPFCFSALTLVLTEWIHRGDLDDFWQSYFFPHKNAYYLAFLLLLACYLVLLILTRRHWPATLGVGVLGCLPAAVCFFELQLRGEPFLPWDFSQFEEATQVVGKAGLVWQTSMKVSLALVLAATVLAAFLPKITPGWKKRLVEAALSVSLLLGIVFGVYLQPQVTLDLGIVPDEWMQDRYYRYYGVITGFMTNLQNLDIDEPEDYSEESVLALKEELLSQPQPAPLFAGSYAAQGQTGVDAAHHHLCDGRVLLGCEPSWRTTVSPLTSGDLPQSPQIAGDFGLGPGVQPQLRRRNLRCGVRGPHRPLLRLPAHRLQALPAACHPAPLLRCPPT